MFLVHDSITHARDFLANSMCGGFSHCTLRDMMWLHPHSTPHGSSERNYSTISHDTHTPLWTSPPVFTPQGSQESLPPQEWHSHS